MRFIFGMLAVAFVVIFTFPNIAMSQPNFPNEHLSGVDSVYVLVDMREHDLWPKSTNREISREDPYQKAVEDVFSSQPWITVIAQSGQIAAKHYQSNVLLLHFTLSLQEEIFDGRKMKLGALSLRLERNLSGKRVILPAFDRSFPFVVPASVPEMNKKISEGISALSGHFPAYITCGNKRGYPSDTCPDCSLDACKNVNTYGGGDNSDIAVVPKNELR